VPAAAVTELFSLVARALDVPMRAADTGASTAKDIPVGGFAMAVLMWAVVGTVLAVVFARRAKAPAHTFVITTVVLIALSLLGPVLATHTELSTKVVLFVAHLIAAAMVIPPLTTRLRQIER
jgi:CHASE2 domain-containing sensor protein